MIADTSAYIPLFVTHPLAVPASTAVGDGRPLHVPEFSLIEAANTLWKYGIQGGMSSADIKVTLGAIRTQMTVWPDMPLLEDAAEIALGLRHPVYDCLFIALALQRGEPLATADRKLAEVARRAGVEAVLIEAG